MYIFKLLLLYLPTYFICLIINFEVVAGAVNYTWVDSSKNIHAFLTFDRKATEENINRYGDKIDYVWGSSESKISIWQRNQSLNKNVILSKYIPFSRDPTPHLGKPPSGLPWWKKNHPELVLYRCDKKTPAWECFAGEGCSHLNVPLDLTNPKTLDYQMSSAVLPAAKIGYRAIALDNYGLTNQWGACGAFKGENNAWVQLYTSKTDLQYGIDVLDWTKRAVERIHTETGLLVIPNFSSMDMKNPQVLEVGNLTDGILAEGGFTSWNPIPNTTSMHQLPPMTNPQKFEEQVHYVRNLQKHNKGFFAINEWGPGPDYNLNPSCIPQNITRKVREFVVAAFMMTNSKSSGIFLTCIQCYGGGCGGIGNFSIWPPEFNAQVGTPVGEPVKNETTGVWTRNYSNAIALVNPSLNETKAVFIKDGGHDGWGDLYGVKYKSNSLITIKEGSGMILLKV